LGVTFGVFFWKIICRGWLLLSLLRVALEILTVFLKLRRWREVPKVTFASSWHLQLLYCFQKGPLFIKIAAFLGSKSEFLTFFNWLTCFEASKFKIDLRLFLFCLVKVNLFKALFFQKILKFFWKNKKKDKKKLKILKKVEKTQKRRKPTKYSKLPSGLTPSNTMVSSYLGPFWESKNNEKKKIFLLSFFIAPKTRIQKSSEFRNF